MRDTTRNRLIYSIVFVIFVVSITVIVGWFMQLEPLKSIFPGWPTMKITTAICFYVTGLILICIKHLREGRIVEAQTILPIASFFLFVVVSTILVAIFLNLPSGLEFIFEPNLPQAVREIPINRPSPGTLTAFYLIGCAGLLSIYRHDVTNTVLMVIGWMIVVLGSLAILGFTLDIPYMYYSFRGTSNAMALHTAILLCLTGLCFLMLSEDT